MNDIAKSFYNTFKQKGVNYGDEDDFEFLLGTEDGVKSVYNKAIEKGLYIDDLNTFKVDLGIGQTTNQSSSPATSTAGQTPEAANQEKKEEGFLQQTFGNTAQAQMFTAQAADAKRKEEENARQEQDYQTVGMSEQDKRDAAFLKSAEAGIVYDDMGIAHPTHVWADNEYGLPIIKTEVDITKQIINERKKNMSPYVLRGENSPEDIMLNAAERALNTDAGKTIWSNILQQKSLEFHSSPEFVELMTKYSTGEITEEDVNKAFNDKYGDQIYNDFFNEISKEGGIMHNYITVAENKFTAKNTDETSQQLEYRIDAALDKSRKEASAHYREDYKALYHVYPEDDPLSDTRLKALRASDSKWNDKAQTGSYELLCARKFNNETRTLIEAVQQGKNFWQGIGDAATDLDTWDFGISELARTAELMSVIKKVDANEELTDAEEILMESALNYFSASAYYSKKLGRGYKAGQTSMASVPFMLQFALSSGTITAMEASIKGSVDAGRRALVNGMIKYARKKSNAKLARYGIAKASGDVGKLAGSVISGASSSVVGAGYMTLLYGTPRIAGGTIERMNGRLVPKWDDEQGKYVFSHTEDNQGLGEAMWNSFADTYIENLSEMVLAKTLDPVRAYLGGTEMFRKIARNDFIGAIVDIRNNPTIKSLRQTTQFGGYFEEVAEEYLGGLLRRMANTDVNTWQEAGLDLDGQIDIFLGLAPTSILFGTYGTARHYGNIAIKRKELREYLSTDEQKEMFDRLMSESRSGQFGDVAHEFIRNVLTSTDPKMTLERKKAMLMDIAIEYHNLLSNELQNISTQVVEEEAKPEIDELTQSVMHNTDNAIYSTVDSQGNPLFIVGGNVQFTNDNVVDLSRSDNKLRVRYVGNDNLLGEEQEIRTANLTMPITNQNVEAFSEYHMAKFVAQARSLDTFEFGGRVYSISGKDLGTVEEYQALQEMPKEGEEPKINTNPRTVVNEEYTVTIDGEKRTVKITSIAGSPMVQREDGSIKSGKFSITVDGVSVRGEESKKQYIKAISDLLKANHAKALEAYRAKLTEKPVVETPTSVLTEEDKAAATAEQAQREREAARRAILNARKKDKDGDIDMEKLTPEQRVVTYMGEKTPKEMNQLLQDELIYLDEQISDIQGQKLSPTQKDDKTTKIRKQVKAYEEAIVKWLGQETLDSMNAARAAALQAKLDTPPAQGGAPLVEPKEPVVEPQVPLVETKEPVVEPKEPVVESLQDETPAPSKEVEQAPISDKEVDEAPISIDLNKVAIYKRKMLGNNSDMYRFVEKGEEGEEDGVEDLFQTTPQGAKKSRSEKFVKQTPEFGFINSNTPCIILNRVYKDGYANVLTEHGLQKVNLKQVTSTKKENNIIREQEDNNQKYQTFDELMGFDLIHVGGKGGLVITLKDVIDIERTKKPFNAIEEKIKLALEKYSAKNADIKAITTDNIQEFTRRFNEAIRLWNKLIVTNNLDVSQVKGRMGKDSKHNPINELRQSFTEVARENIIRIEAGETPLLSDELLNSFNSFDATHAFVSKDVKEMDYQQMINYLLDIYQAKDNFDIDNNEFKVLVDEVLSHLAHKPSKAQMTKGNQKDNMRMPRINFMKEIGMKAQEEGGVYKDILKEALRKANLKEAAKYQVDQTLVEELSTDEQTEVNETPEKTKKTSKSKGRKKKEDGTIDLGSLSDSIIALSIKANDMSRIQIEREMAKITIDKYLEELSEDNILALYERMIKERDASKGIMVDDINRAMETVEASKNGSIITRKREEAIALINARLAEEAAQQQAQEQAEEVVNSEEEATAEEPVAEEPVTEEPVTEEPIVEETVTEEPAKKSADVLKREIEELNERLNNLSIEEEEEFDAILAQIQEKNQQLEEMGKGYREKKTSKPREKYSGMADSAAGATNYDMDEGFNAAYELMVGDVAESSASQEAKELALAAEIQVLADSEDIEVLNVTQEQAEEAKRTGKPEMQVSNETQRIFVSNAERAVESIKQEKATPQQWKAMIEKQGGFKAGEDKWLGLSEWLDNQDKKTLTKQEILDFIAKNRIIIAEVHYADGNGISEEDVLNSEAFSNLLNELWDWSGDEPVIDMQKFRELKDDDDFVDGFDTDYWNETLIVRDPAKAAKYLGIANPINDVRLTYTTSGLDAKREIAIVIPTIATWNSTDEIHFGDAGGGRAIAWVRFGETNLPLFSYEPYRVISEKLDNFIGDMVKKYGFKDLNDFNEDKLSDEDKAKWDDYGVEIRRRRDEAENATRVLVIDEIQSKRHQEGREKGYYASSGITSVESLKNRVKDLESMAFDIRGKLDIMNISVTPENMSNEDAAEYYKLQEELLFVRNNRDYDRINAEIDAIKSKYNQQDRENLDKKLKDINEELEKLNSVLDKSNAKDRVPDAPFDKNWHELAMKRMLRYAAENGYGYVAWTTGEQQAERYDIGEVVDKILTTNHNFRGNARKSVNIMMTNGSRESIEIDNAGIITKSDNGVYNGKNLSELVGKELSDRIINNEGQDATLFRDGEDIPAKELSGENLRIGGEGMKGFYDKILPSFVNKYTKKWGAKVQDINLPFLEDAAQTMHAVNVTPEMKESVMQGQPMFSIESTPLMSSKGVIYGYALGNKIYLTPDGMNTNTPVHEYTHIWAKAMQKHNPKAWKSIVEQLKKAEALWNEVVNDPNYENIKNDEDAIASEVLSRYSGKNGAAKLEAEAERVVSEYKGMEKGLKVKALISRVKKALEKFWNWVGKDLFKIESFESIDQIADRVLYDMLNNTQLNLDNSKKSSTFAENNENYERTNEFRELQERSNSLSESAIAEYHSQEREFSDEDRARVGGVFQRLMESERNGGRNGQWINLIGKGNQFKMAQVNPAIFHDIFQICRNYLPNGELVDLHDNYADCKCFISDDGLCGFAIEPNGNLISVFSLNPSDKKGFLYAIKDLIRQEGATHLDCYVSSKQPLTEIYQKALGFHVASEMDYNMEYDHDNIAENHGMPKIAFMVDKPTEKREFDGESYDAAYEYQQSQTSTAEREQIIAEAKASGTFMLAPNGQPTNLTEDQWVDVRTQAFKDWFGDWQNDPANASKVLDKNGEPLVVYHGTKFAGFDVFEQLDEDVTGFFTTDSREGANTYATDMVERMNDEMKGEARLGEKPHHAIYSLFANIRNPKVYDFKGKSYNEYGEPNSYHVTMFGEEWDRLPVPRFSTKEEALQFAYENGVPESSVKGDYLMTDDLVEIAKEEGYDGVFFMDVIDGAEHTDQITMNDFVAFEKNQLKSATQNIGTFNPEDNRIEFMIGPAAPSASAGAPRDPSDPMTIDSEAARRLQVKSQKYFKALANPNAQLPDELNALNKVIAHALDRTEGIRQIMESIEKFRKENGMPPMGEGFDVRTMVEAMDSKIANETKLFVMTKENELRKAIYKLAKRIEKSDFYKKYQYEKVNKQDGKKSKLTPREIIERYLIACDSIEREELKGNPRGAGEFLRRMGVDMVQYRQEFLDAFASTKKGTDEISHLWECIRGVTDMVISEGERSGLISQDEAVSYRRRRFYVPERDFAEVEANEELQIKDAGYGSGRMGNKLMATQEAEGGETLAANVLANMTLLARDAIVKANKNIVKLAMFDMLRTNEDWCRAEHVPIPRQVWYKRDADGKVKRVTDGPTEAEKKLMRDLKSQIRDRENEIREQRALAETAKDEAAIKAHMDIIAEIEEEIESLRQAHPFLDEFDTRDMMFLSRHTQKESTVTVFVDGAPCEMYFPNMTIVANALNGTTNKKFAAEGLKKLTSALSATMTVYNPAFFTVNVVRDIPFILAKGYAEYGWQFPVRFAGQLVKTFFTLDVWKAVAGNYKDVKSPYVREFFEGGGNTGYSTIPDIDKLKSATKRWDRRRTDIGMQDIGDVISYMNTFSEVWTRLAAYSVVRDMGGTKEDGVRAAKNLSVNFNRKGLGAPIWDTFMNMSFFANAALQGASGFYRTFKGNKDTFAKNVAVGFRAANAFLATPMFAGFISTLLHPDDDDKLLWINDWDRDNYWYVGNSGKRIAINEQIKPAWVIGVNIALGMKGRRTKEQIASSIISSVLTNWLPAPQNVNGALTMAINSHYGTKDYSTAQVVENLLVPQAMASFTDIANNVDFMGYKIKNESGDLPAYMSNENSALLYKMVAEFLYKANGGDKDLPSKHIEVMNEDGTIDYKKMSDLYDKSPKEINTILSVAIGSTWKDFGNAIAVASTDGEFVPTDYQTIKRFYKPTDKEMTILSIMREARGITKDYTVQYNNYINQIAGSAIDGNTEKKEKGKERIKNLVGTGEDRGEKHALMLLVNAYDANTMYRHAKHIGMNETQFRSSLKKYNPEMLEAFERYNRTTREELVRKILTLTRDIKDMEVKDGELIDKIEDLFGVNE